MRKLISLMIAFIFIGCTVSAQKNRDILIVNKNGRMIWRNNGQEAFFWGVNYTAPFSHAFRQIARVGEDREKTVEADSYHLARLGANAYRIHVWDIEISDSIGNLLENDHLKLFDYMLNQFRQRGIYIFLTPILLGGNGYPEPNERLNGFSGRYNKGNAYTDPEAIAYQERYIKQFVSHVNPYSGIAYKNDPMILGFEICNEPSNSRKAETTAFVKRMTGAIRSAGCTKPLFYNVTQNISLLEDYIKGGTNGVTFQWYPSGLVSGHEVPGTFLPHVDNYYMPFKNEKYFANQARLVYEFDPADIGRSYMYPPTAISFKEAGMQFVAMFAYDPVAIAKSNTEYQTHFLNLVYAPQKALGFKIAGEVFRNPKFKRDRENETRPFEMDGLKINYQEDIAELATDELFYHTNNTSTNPPDLSTLRSIAGYGSSPIISYKGRGAYFLDKISDGVWRLEVMPDAVWVRDPFSRATPRIENVVIKWNKYEMKAGLPGLGQNFLITGINNGNNYTATAREGKFEITPGAYILSNSPVSDGIKKTKIGVITANEYYAPKETNNRFYFLHSAPSQVSEGQPVEVSVQVISPADPIKSLVIQPSLTVARGQRGFRPLSIPMEKTDGYEYKAVIPDSVVRAGNLSYTIISESTDGKTTVFPGGIAGPITSWEYYNPDIYSVKVINAASEVQLFTAESTEQTLTFIGNPSLRNNRIVTGVNGGSKMRFDMTGDNVSKRQNLEVICVMQNYVADVISSIAGYYDKYSRIIINGRALDKPVRLDLILINKDGNAFTAKTTLTADKNFQSFGLKDLTEGRMVLLPRPYPVFLPFWYNSKMNKPFSLSEIEKIQMVIPDEGNEEFSGFELTSITLQ